MKVPKRHYDQIFWIHLPIVAISLTLILCCKNQIILSFKAHWLILLAALLLIFLPVGNYRLGKDDESPRLKWPLWLGLILLLEISLYLMFYLFCYVIDTNTINPPVDVMRLLHWNWGLFPWGIYTLVAVALGFFSFKEQQPGLISITIQPLFKNTVDDAVGIGADNYARLLVLFSICLTLCFVCLVLVTFAVKFYHLPTLWGLKISTMAFVSTLLSVIYLPEYQKFTHKVLSYNLPIFVVVTVFVILLALLILFFAFVFHFIAQYVPLINLQSPLFSSNNTRAYFIISAGIWWILWAALFSGSVAYLSEGYRIRTVVIGILALPVLISLSLMMHWNISKINSPWLGLILAVLALLILFSFFLRKKYLTHLMRAALPKTKIKARSSLHYLRRLLQVVTLLVIAYLIGGINLISIISFLLGLPAGMMMIYASVSFYKKIMSKKNPP